MPKKTHSYDPIKSVVYCPRRDGSADVWLRENIESEEIYSDVGVEDAEGTKAHPGAITVYSADEVHFKTRHTREYIEEHFDEMWVAAAKAEKPLENRVAELEDQLGAAIDVLLMMSEEV